VPFILYGSQGEFRMSQPVTGYDEDAAASTGLFLDHGYQLMEKLVGE
jgi:2,3-bisphosphoglycerate-independent phosphoglycerate mutase